MTDESVPVDPFRERFEKLREKEELSLSEVAHRIGWTNRPSKLHPEGVPDTTRVARVLGIAPDHGGKHRVRISYENAVRFCRALHIDPFEAGV